jgi:hypothetical protein
VLPIHGPSYRLKDRLHLPWASDRVRS